LSTKTIWALAAYLVIALVPLTSLAAHVYQSKGADGSTVFSDQPSPQAREIDIDVPASAPAPSVGGPNALPPKAEPAPAITVAYRTLKIIEPKNDALFWFADGPIKVQADIVPPLAQGHVLVPLLNGVAQGDGVAGNAFALTDLDPDTYELVVVIRDAKGRELKRSSPVRFYFRRQSINLPARRPPPKSGG
jgi:hypothetical protein